MKPESNKDGRPAEGAQDAPRRFFVKAPSVSVVRKALHRAPGGAKVVGHYDRDTVECLHTMDEHSYNRHWPVLISRIEKAGLQVVMRPTQASNTT
jgi:hypothetical protein